MAFAGTGGRLSTSSQSQICVSRSVPTVGGSHSVLATTSQQVGSGTDSFTQIPAGTSAPSSSSVSSTPLFHNASIIPLKECHNDLSKQSRHAFKHSQQPHHGHDPCSVIGHGGMGDTDDSLYSSSSVSVGGDCHPTSSSSSTMSSSSLTSSSSSYSSSSSLAGGTFVAFFKLRTTMRAFHVRIWDLHHVSETLHLHVFLTFFFLYL